MIYLDNAATSFPKAPGVPEAMSAYLTDCACNINRGCYGRAYDLEERVYDTRVRLCRLFGGEDPRTVIFTKNITESLNVLLRGLLRPGDHVLVSSLEHNAVMRPLRALEAAGVTFTRLPCDGEGNLDLTALKPALRPNTRAVILTHASNVSGTLQPIREVGRFCRESGLRFLVDSAQTAGVFPLSLQEDCIDALAFTGHKGLLGPQGTGGFLVREDLARELSPFLLGGTGSQSHLEEMPDFLPDKFEAGTLNLPGILGLNAALRFLEDTGLEEIRRRELALTDCFLQSLSPMEQEGRLRIIGPHGTQNRCGTVSVTCPGRDNAEIAAALDSRYEILTRVGLHCAPAAHRALGTYPEGTIRFSFGFFNTEEEAAAAAGALTALLREETGMVFPTVR